MSMTTAESRPGYRIVLPWLGRGDPGHHDPGHHDPHHQGRAVRALLLVLAMAACTPPPPTAETRATAATLAACRERADEIYDRQNRGAIYSISNRDTPFSTDYVPDVTSRGLPQLFSHNQQVRDCIRNTGSTTDRGTQQTGTQQPGGQSTGGQPTGSADTTH